MKQIDDITWQSNDGLITFKNMDCNEFMAGCKENEFDLNLSDPPYSISFSGYQRGSSGVDVKERYTKNGKKEWDNQKPTIEQINELKRTSKNQIIWGYNHLADVIGSCSNFIFWFKKNPVPNFADGELAFTSFKGVARCFEYMYYGNINSEKDRIHETQKPVELYKWILDNYTKPTDTILDCFGGSMSHAIACHMKRRKLTIIELDKDYFDMALLRFSEYEQKVEDIKEFGYAKTKINAQNPVLF